MPCGQQVIINGKKIVTHDGGIIQNLQEALFRAHNMIQSVKLYGKTKTWEEDASELLKKDKNLCGPR